jgi:hypothetical protein
MIILFRLNCKFLSGVVLYTLSGQGAKKLFIGVDYDCNETDLRRRGLEKKAAMIEIVTREFLSLETMTKLNNQDSL